MFLPKYKSTINSHNKDKTSQKLEKKKPKGFEKKRIETQDIIET